MDPIKSRRGFSNSQSHMPVRAMYICGARSFKTLADDGCQWSAGGGGCSPKKKASKNPYSARGLDKFSSLLADLEARRAEIMASAGERGVAMVRFSYSKSNEWIPIVVKLREPRPAAKVKSPSPPPTEKDGDERAKEVGVLDMKDKQKGRSWSRPRPSCLWWWWPLVVILLLCLVLFGRVFAVCCTTLAWYMVSIVQGRSGSAAAMRRSFKEKDYRMRLTSLQPRHRELTSPKAYVHERMKSY